VRHTSFLAVFLVVVCGDARANHAPPDTNAVLTELQSLQASLTSASTPGSERAAIADRALKLRADLIEAAPEDDRASSWMLDQAEAILARAAYDGADASVLFGIPTPAQRTRIADAASQSAAYVDRAGPAAAKFVARLQDSIFRAKDAPAAQLKELATRAESRMNAIVDTDQAWREPLLRARCAVLISATEAPATRNVRLRDALTSLARITPPPGRAEEVQRLTFAAAAIALRDDTGALLAARQQLQRLVHQTPAPDPLTIAQARAATALTALSAGEALAGAHELRTALASDPAKTGQPFGLADLILAEGAARVIIAFPSPDSYRSSWLEDGFSGLVGIMDSESRSGDAAFIAALARAKIGAATDPAMPFSALPAQIAFARAVTLASGPSALPIRPGETDEPALLLAMVAQRTDASSDLRADALWELSVVQLQKRPEPERLRAADTLCRLAESFPASRRVRQAAEAAPAIARSAVLASTTNEERARALAVYRPGFSSKTPALRSRRSRSRSCSIF
jgi:hypothetical protein